MKSVLVGGPLSSGRGRFRGSGKRRPTQRGHHDLPDARYSTADYWRQSYGNGSWPSDLAAKFDREKVRYAYTESGDVRFLEWACRTRRGCGITVLGGAHMVTLVHLDDQWAAILDNNNVSKFIWVPRTALIANLPQKRTTQTLAGKLRANGLQRIG